MAPMHTVCMRIASIGASRKTPLADQAKARLNRIQSLTSFRRLSSAFSSFFCRLANCLLSEQGVRPDTSACAASTWPSVTAAARAAAARVDARAGRSCWALHTACRATRGARRAGCAVTGLPRSASCGSKRAKVSIRAEEGKARVQRRRPAPQAAAAACAVARQDAGIAGDRRMDMARVLIAVGAARAAGSRRVPPCCRRARASSAS